VRKPREFWTDGIGIIMEEFDDSWMNKDRFFKVIEIVSDEEDKTFLPPEAIPIKNYAP
jgi:hypothetical protein